LGHQIKDSMVKLGREFFQQEDVVQVSKDLLGKYLITNIQNIKTQGLIIETEAYAGVKDKASHAYNGRRTARTETMYQEGGIAYIYLCYGLHHLLNVVTNVKNVPHAILIRSIQPVHGIDEIRKRRNLNRSNTKLKDLCPGPGTVSQGLGLTIENDGESFLGNKIWIEESGITISEKDIVSGSRIGVAYAEEDALLPYRFRLI